MICHKLVIKKEETLPSSKETAESPSSAQQFFNSQKSLSIKIINTRNDELQKIHTVKNCTLVINDSPLEYITPEFNPQHHIENTAEPPLKEYHDSSESDVEEENLSVDDSSSSDWEKEFFGINFESKKKCNIETYPSNSLYTKERIYNSKSNRPILSKNSNTKNPMTNPTNNDLAKLSPENNTGQLQSPVKTTNQKNSFCFVPKVGCGSILDFQNSSNKNNQYQTLVLSGPLDLHKSKINGGGNTVFQTPVQPPNHNKSITLSHAIEGTSEKDNGLNFRKILPKPCLSYTFGVVKASSKCSFAQNAPSGHSNNQDSPTENNLALCQYLYHCKECDKLFEALEPYVYHKQASLCYKKRQEVNYQCDICGKRLANDERLQEHKNWHTNARPFKCSYCGKRYNSKKARLSHYKMKHSNQKLKSTRYVCSYCGYSNSKLKYLLAHEEVHRLPEGAEIPKPFECKECGKHFRFSTSLRHHLQFHSPASFFCDICDKGFKSKGNLKQHMISHSDARPISCLLCGDRFKRTAHLRQHKSAVHGEGRN